MQNGKYLFMNQLFIYSFVAFNEAFESRPHNSFVVKSLYISWRNFFVKIYSDVFSEVKY